MLTAVRAALTALMRGIPAARRPALRRSDDPAWLLATDLPTVAEAADAARFVALAERSGWRVGFADNGWLLLDRLDLLPAASVPTALPGGEIGALISLLLRHPSDTPDENALRAVAKAAERGPSALEQACRGLHAAWAEALREHRKLPGALLPYLCAAAGETEENVC